MNTQELINRISQETGIPVSKNRLYHYEAQGMILAKRDKDNDFRDWAEKDYPEIKLIVQLTDSGVPLETIKDYLLNKRGDELPALLLKKENNIAECIKSLNK